MTWTSTPLSTGFWKWEEVDPESRYNCWKQKSVICAQKLEKFSSLSPYCWNSRRPSRQVLIFSRVSASLRATMQLKLTNGVLGDRFAAIYMGNITISSVSSSMADFLQKPTICSLATTSIEVNSPSRRFAYCSHTRSNIPRTFLSSGGTMNVRRSIAYTGFMMSASGDTTLSCGRHSPTASTACPLQQSLTRRSLQCMEVWAQTWIQWSKFVALCDLQTYVELLTLARFNRLPSLTRKKWPADSFRYPIVASCATYSGQILTKTLLAGAKMTVVSRSHLVPMLCLDSCRNMTWILFAARIKSSKMDTNFSPRGSLSLCSAHLIIAGNSTMRALWWALTRACCVRFRCVSCP